MSFLAVTTFNGAGLQQYGERMMRSWQQHWSVPLRIYSEGWKKPEWAEAFNVLPIESSGWLAAFKVRHASLPTADYRMDAVRFCHKIAALLEADRHMTARYLIWVDGDTFTHTPVPMTEVERWTPKNGDWIAWLDRRKVYPECGFYIIDREHPRHVEMMGRLYEMYADDRLFQESEWHDSYVLQQCVLQAGVGATSLSGPIGWRTAHPFINGPLGAYMDHMKGKRKRKGRSHATDLQVRRKEKYWA